MTIKYVFNPFTGKFDTVDVFDEDTIVTDELGDVVSDENGNVVVNG